LEKVDLQRWELYNKQRNWITVILGWSVSPSIQQNHLENPGGTSINKTINRAELAGIVAALKYEHTLLGQTALVH
jgi:ribonuclease HI